MRSTLKNQRNALTALALGFATAAIFATTSAARVGTEPTPGQYSDDLEAEQAMIHAPRFSRITSAAELYAGQLEPTAAESAEIPYLSWGATAEDLGPFKPQKAISYLSWGATADDRGPFLVYRVETPYLSWGATAADLSPFTQGNQSGEGVTPTNLARAYHPIEHVRADGFQPQTKSVGSATVSASSDGLDRGDLALGFGLGLILATACAIALAMTRDRQRTRMAHS
jgi:hypothetical protein